MNIHTHKKGSTTSLTVNAKTDILCRWKSEYLPNLYPKLKETAIQYNIHLPFMLVQRCHQITEIQALNKLPFRIMLLLLLVSYHSYNVVISSCKY